VHPLVGIFATIAISATILIFAILGIFGIFYENCAPIHKFFVTSIRNPSQLTPLGKSPSLWPVTKTGSTTTITVGIYDVGSFRKSETHFTVI
jgi:hypothetical protein